MGITRRAHFPSLLHNGFVLPLTNEGRWILELPCRGEMDETRTCAQKDREMDGWSGEEWIRSKLFSGFAVYRCLSWSPRWGDTWCAVITQHTRTRTEIFTNILYTHSSIQWLTLQIHMHTNIQKQVIKAHRWSPLLIISRLSHLISSVNAGALHGAENSPSIPQALFKRERERATQMKCYI